MPPPAWTAPPATNMNVSGMAAEAFAEIAAVQFAARGNFVAFAPDQAQGLQPVDREFVGQRATLDDLPDGRNQIRLPLQPQQVIAQVVAERTAVVPGGVKELLDAAGRRAARHHVERLPRQVRVTVHELVQALEVATRERPWVEGVEATDLVRLKVLQPERHADVEWRFVRTVDEELGFGR